MSARQRLYLAIGIGGMLGSVARSLVSLAMLSLMGPGLAWGTLTVNVLGSLLIGLYATLSEPGGRIRASAAQRQFVLAGFCGGFTTFSIFSLETVLLAAQGTPGLAALNIGVSLVLWLLAVWCGYRIGQHLNLRAG